MIPGRKTTVCKRCGTLITNAYNRQLYCGTQTDSTSCSYLALKDNQSRYRKKYRIKPVHEVKIGKKMYLGYLKSQIRMIRDERGNITGKEAVPFSKPSKYDMMW